MNAKTRMPRRGPTADDRAQRDRLPVVGRRADRPAAKVTDPDLGPEAQAAAETASRLVRAKLRFHRSERRHRTGSTDAARGDGGQRPSTTSPRTGSASWPISARLNGVPQAPLNAISPSGSRCRGLESRSTISGAGRRVVAERRRRRAPPADGRRPGCRTPPARHRRRNPPSGGRSGRARPPRWCRLAIAAPASTAEYSAVFSSSSLVGAQQDQRAGRLGVALPRLSSSAIASKVSSPRRPTTKRTGWRSPQVGRPAGGLQQRGQICSSAQLGGGVEDPRAPPGGDRRVDGHRVSAQPVGGLHGHVARLRGREKSGAPTPYPCRNRSPSGWKGSDSGARRAEVRRILGGGRRADPPRRRAHRRDQEGRATTSSSSSRRWATPPTTCSTSPSRSARRRRPREMDMLLTSGERISNALVAMAIDSLGAAGPLVHRVAGRRDHHRHARQRQDHRRHPGPAARRRSTRARSCWSPGSRASARTARTSPRWAAAAPTPPPSRWPRR